MPLPVVRIVAGVLRKHGQLLLCHRRPDRASYPDVWDLPGGHVDDGESIVQALVRELDEELGVQVDSPQTGPWLTLTADGVELSVFLIDHWQGEPDNVAVDEHDHIRWVTTADLIQLDLAHPSYEDLLRRALD
jgi:8-oxo-dGTP diphosphatase